MTSGARRLSTGKAVALVAAVALTGGCAERQLVARPRATPGTTAWVAVWIAGSLAAVVVGVLLTLPAWRVRGGARVAVMVLTVQTGAAVVVGLVLAGVGVRSWQLVGRSVDAHPAVALVRLSRVDGDTALVAVMVLLIVVLSALVAILTATSAQLAAEPDSTGRLVACAVLAVELILQGYATVRLVGGAHGWPFLGSALALPVVALAFVTCWPRGAERDASEYNSEHG